MVADAEANAEADKKFEELVTARNAADGMFTRPRRRWKKLVSTPDDERRNPGCDCEAEEALKGDDKDGLKQPRPNSPKPPAVLHKRCAAQAEAGEAPAGERQRRDVEGTWLMPSLKRSVKTTSVN